MFHEKGLEDMHNLFNLQSELYLKHINHVIPTLLNMNSKEKNKGRLQNEKIHVESEID